MSTFSLKIVACNKVFYDGECEILIYPAYDGQMAIMANHEQMTSTVEIVKSNSSFLTEHG